MKKLITLTLVFALFFTTLTVYAEKPDADLNIPKSSSSSSSSKESTKDVPVPDDVTPVKAYTVSVGKSYKLPAAIKKAGDSYATGNSAILTVDKATGNFKMVSKGTAYLVVTNGTNKSYIKITAGMETTNGTKAASNTTSILSGYSVTVNDTTKPAVTAYGQMSNNVYVYYFISTDGIKLGSITGDDQRKIAQAGVDNGTIPTESKDMAVWFANEFNVYRGIKSAPINTVNPITKIHVNTEDYANKLAESINSKRSKKEITELFYDTSFQNLASTRAKEVSTTWGHTRPDGSIVTQNGYAEIITTGFTPEKAFENFSNSDAHNSIMIDERYTSYAVGCYEADNGYIYWAVVFT